MAIIKGEINKLHCLGAIVSPSNWSACVFFASQPKKLLDECTCFLTEATNKITQAQKLVCL